jgi:hypothetical protein
MEAALNLHITLERTGRFIITESFLIREHGILTIYSEFP